MLFATIPEVSIFRLSDPLRLSAAALAISRRHFSMSSASRSSTREAHSTGHITLEEWRGWGCVSPVPVMVNEVIQDLKLLEKSSDVQMVFGGIGGKLQGDFRIQEDKKHRATYQALDDSKKKFEFYSARQIACRLLGSRGYLCQKVMQLVLSINFYNFQRRIIKFCYPCSTRPTLFCLFYNSGPIMQCWLPSEDCMCSKVKPCTLWHGVRFWLYMHPKDFLRQNNTGKLLWQVFGVQSATLCLYGIAEDEENMWNAFKTAGKSKIWCLYPNQNTLSSSVQDTFTHEPSAVASLLNMEDRNSTLNFVLIDGTWSNSGAMFRRLKEQAKSVWGVEEFPCISLSAGASAMHKLRPQPSWDRTCTAAAAIGLLTELQSVPEFRSCGLIEQAEAVEDAIVVLLDALTNRRLRMGRSIARKTRHSRDIC